MLYLDPTTQSPDPTMRGTTYTTPSGTTGIDVYPHEVIAARPAQPAVSDWSQHLHMHRAPPSLALKADSERRLELLLDFGTEVDAELELVVQTTGPFHLLVWFGESQVEAEGLLYGQFPPATLMRHVPGSGQRSIAFPQRGFRFVRLVFQELPEGAVLERLVAHAEFALGRRQGSFFCSDRRFQRVWESSLYTAKLCVRSDAIWDGIKRDRKGWYGDARIIAHAVDLAYQQPEPMEAMLLLLPVDAWANGVPGFSFDAIAIARRHILTYGLERPCLRAVFERIRQLLAWVEATQTNADGFIVRTDQRYFADLGFLDWSPYPVGGRFEELSWLQCQYAAGLRAAADLADWFGEVVCATQWRRQYAALSQLIQKLFWDPERGFIHTLNRVDDSDLQAWPPDAFHHLFTRHLDGTRDGIALGPSAASRQGNALAIWAGIASAAMRATIMRAVFDNPAIPSVRTPYFAYYEAFARASCGDRRGAVLQLRDYVGTMLEAEQSPTVWERYQPELQDLRKYASFSGWSKGWVLSLCHGWGAGAVPLAAAVIAGVEATAPGYGAVAIDPGSGLDWSFTAEIPTPHGPIHVERSAPGEPVRYRIPRPIQLTHSDPASAIITRC